MEDQTTPTRVRASADVVAAFRRASADENPLHVDAGYARRTAFGEPVVYGVLGALLALAGLEPRPDRAPARVRARFQAPVLARQECSRDVVEDTPGRAVVRLRDGERVLLEVTVDFRTGPGAAPVPVPPDAGEGRAPRTEARDAAPADLVPGLPVGAGYAPRWAALRELTGTLDLTGRGLGPVEAGVLCWISYLVGMEAPGRAALLSELDVAFEAPASSETSSAEAPEAPEAPECAGESAGETATPDGAATDRPGAAGPFVTRATVTELDERFRLLRLEGTAEAPGLRARARVRAFHREDAPATDVARLAALLPEGRPLAGRTALVVGASRGLGAAVTQALALQGARVYAGFHRSADDMTAVAAALGEDAASRIHPLRGDAADAEWCAAAVDRIHAESGRLDLLVLNACPAPTRMPLAPDASARAADHLARAVALAREPLAACAARVAADGGRVLAVSSAWAADPQPGWSAYVTAKSAVEGLVRAAAAEFPEASWTLARPPRLRTAMTATPLSTGPTAPVEPVAAALARAAAEPAAPGRTEVLEFAEDGTPATDGAAEPPAARPDGAGLGGAPAAGA
ncbi:SDR family NAD(P)-dependent oxidoreductase, partial [Streptomyces sp. JJ36]|uniref:SDR family NAD(P)-dependent oxidoreductase n=1 Tax=Streptomyces sp. JJ36 TaxID=2736645 RepID=UPI001F1D091E